MSSSKKLYRLRPGRKLSGVCASVAEYFDIDPVILRARFVASLIFGGTGISLYVVIPFMTPER